jgi:hypothetical protein
MELENTLDEIRIASIILRITFSVVSSFFSDGSTGD